MDIKNEKKEYGRWLANAMTDADVAVKVKKWQMRFARVMKTT